ncbi:NRDE family protein [Pedobacter frigiditerrae]|uniref:NRDE family protein n=1 Tax=Pedobacter frigiditerrae TaxID=2530452 RepID=UPI00292FCE71|nr:NRDE family protein [Pedobacter frigiditerrae]
MCTVSYIPTDEGIIITSNRDENSERGCAFAPVIEKQGEYQLAYPKDPKSGGTWIAVKDNGDVAVLLNGAFENHVKLPSYRKSRGIILLEIIQSKFPEKTFDQISLAEIENFTLILYKKGSLMECRWDGFQKHKKSINVNQPCIWSSATLYSRPIRDEREQWFASWLEKEPNINQDKAIRFHQFAGTGDQENALVMARSNNISTVSITSVKITSATADMLYKDLKSGIDKEISFKIPRAKTKLSIFENLKLNFRIATIKTFNWEYWPMHLVYAPMYIYWLYLSTKARTFFFFSAANPMRLNSGFAMENKSDSYKHLDQQFYPKTVLFANGTNAPELKARLADNEICFPLIAKPDMGERGTGVKLINNLADLVDYSRQSKANFLTQEFIDYKNEVGIFYHRLPDEDYGKITGIVGKEFLMITGDGKSTLEMLIRKNDRYILQFKTLRKHYGDQLEQILSTDEEKVLVPFGNHCRGAKFIDLSYMISKNLTQVIDNVCKQLPEFYFGRLDIKFKNWNDFEQGKNFSIIELNGAASEPTHMYDPRHSIFFAWGEIKKHWDLLYKISKSNAKNKSIPLMTTVEGMKMLRAHSQHIKGLSKI